MECDHKRRNMTHRRLLSPLMLILAIVLVIVVVVVVVVLVLAPVDLLGHRLGLGDGLGWHVDFLVLGDGLVLVHRGVLRLVHGGILGHVHGCVDLLGHVDGLDVVLGLVHGHGVLGLVVVVVAVSNSFGLSSRHGVGADEAINCLVNRSHPRSETWISTSSSKERAR